MQNNPILDISPLGAQWPTLDPFLFCVHHNDAYPAGNANMGPASSLAGRQIGQDFSGKDGWSMYHGDQVPGFPQHPHRGFETVTVARRGFIDHSDSLSATARFGEGDVQWMTAGQGIVHSEMFPLLNNDAPNPTELFQIWLNLPAKDSIIVTSYAGFLPNGEPSAAPPPSSWAADTHNHVVIWTIKLAPNARWTLPAINAACNRRLYYYVGASTNIAGQTIQAGHALTLRADTEISLTNHSEESEFLLLEGRPIAEPVAQHGPFVMNDDASVRQTISDYQRTQFGGWQWSESGPVHGATDGRFALYPDGGIIRPSEENA
ncbi:MAG: pirin family protein [Alphaproteobacteria bacterium]